MDDVDERKGEGGKSLRNGMSGGGKPFIRSEVDDQGGSDVDGETC